MGNAAVPLPASRAASACKPSTFCVTIRMPSRSRAARASARCAAFGRHADTNSRRQPYHSQTRRGSRAKALGVASDSGRCDFQSPPAPRNVGTPDSARTARHTSIPLPAGCSCDLCQVLGGFLGDPARRSFEWPLAEKGRGHVHRRIDGAELPVRHTTRRTGRPYTLVLTKTDDIFHREQDARRRDRADLTWLRRRVAVAP